MHTYTYIYIHTHTYTYIYIHIHTYTYIYIHIHTYTYVNIHTSTYIYIHIHTYTYLYIPIHTYTYLYIPIHTYTYIYIHIHTYTYIYIHIHTYTYTYIHIHTHTYTYIHIHTHTYTYIHIHTHTYIHTHIHAYIHPYMHTHTYIHAYIHPSIHTYIYICIFIYIYIYIVHPKAVENSRCARTNPASLQVPNWRLRLLHENHSGLEILGTWAFLSAWWAGCQGETTAIRRKSSGQHAARHRSGSASMTNECHLQLHKLWSMSSLEFLRSKVSSLASSLYASGLQPIAGAPRRARHAEEKPPRAAWSCFASPKPCWTRPLATKKRFVPKVGRLYPYGIMVMASKNYGQNERLWDFRPWADWLTFM